MTSAPRGARYHLYRCLVAEGKDAEAKAEQARLDALEADLKEIHELITGKMQRSPNDPGCGLTPA